MITSVAVGTINVNDGVHYAVAQQTHLALVAAVAADARLVQMAGRSPVYVGSTPQARTIPLLVMLLAKSVSERITDYDALVAALSNANGLVSLTWTDDVVGTKRYWVHANTVQPGLWFSRVAADLTAPTPYAEVL